MLYMLIFQAIFQLKQDALLLLYERTPKDMGFLDKINALDTSLLLRLNDNFSEYWDAIMYLGTDKLYWIPLFLSVLYMIVRNKGRESILILLMVVLLLLFSDSISTFIKGWAERPRPSHNSSIMYDLHIVNNYRGGMFGFVSSHAANSFGLALFLLLLVRNVVFSITILMWAAFHTYTRIYLGVHYPFDILGGISLGMLGGYGFYKLYGFVLGRVHLFKAISADSYKTSHTKGGYQIIDVSLVIVVAIFSFVLLLVSASRITDFMP